MREAMLVALKLGGPPLLAGLAVGLVVSLLQAVTQIQESTLAFVPKVVVMAAVLLLTGPAMTVAMQGYAAQLSPGSLPSAVGPDDRNAARPGLPGRPRGGADRWRGDAAARARRARGARDHPLSLVLALVGLVLPLVQPGLPPLPAELPELLRLSGPGNRERAVAGLLARLIEIALAQAAGAGGGGTEVCGARGPSS